MKCEQFHCPFYTIFIDDDGCSSERTPWCLLADTALPDDCFAPYDCIVEDRDEWAAAVEDFRAKLDEVAISEVVPLNNCIINQLYGFESITKKEE